MPKKDKPGIVINGVADVRRALRKLGSKTLAKKVARQAVSASATIVLKAVRRRTPQDEGVLRKAMRKKVYSKGWDHNAVVGADVDEMRDGDRPTNVDHLLEYGHVADGTRVPAQPFVRPAADESLPEARREYERRLKSNITCEARKLARQGKASARRARAKSLSDARKRTRANGTILRGHNLKHPKSR